MTLEEKRTEERKEENKNANTGCPAHSPASTSKLTETDAQSLLAAQRQRRPVAPHLQVYDYSQTWFGGSAWTRITGSIFSGGLYVYATAYLAAPLLGFHLESASLAAAFGALPVAAKATLKLLAAWPFVFHCVNGVRHLVWDLAKGFTRPAVQKGGYAIFAGTTAIALGLVAFV